MDFENGNYAILRVAKLKKFGSIAASGQHNFRERETPNANPEATPLNEHEGALSAEELVQKVHERLPTKRRKDAILCLEYLLSASPEFFGKYWREDKNYKKDYFKDAIDWLEKKHGKENVICSSLHLDESTPHIAVYVVPITKDGRLSAKDFTGGKAKLSKMQTDFANDVGQRYGLKRGIENSKARHTKIQKLYAKANQAFSPLPQVKTIPFPARPEPEKPLFFPTKQKKDEYKEKHDAWVEEQKVNEIYNSEVKAQRDVAVSTARRLEAQAAKASMLAKENRDLKMSNSHFVKRCIELESKAKILDLFTSEEIQAAQNRKQRHDEELLRQEKAEREQKELAIEMSKRIKNIPNLLKNSAGAVYTLAVKASEAMAKHLGITSKIDWKAVETETVIESIGSHGQSAESVTKAILAHSPLRADPASHEQLRSTVQLNAPQLEAKYQQEAKRDRSGPSISR